MGFAPSRRHDGGTPKDEVQTVFDLYPNGKQCFLCFGLLGDAMEDHTVYWAGAAGQPIFLHPACAISLGTHLIKDGMFARDPLALPPIAPPWWPGGWTEDEHPRRSIRQAAEKFNAAMAKLNEEDDDADPR